MSKTKTLPPGIPIADAQGKITAMSVEELFAKLKIGGRNLLLQKVVITGNCSMDAAGVISILPEIKDTYFKLKSTVGLTKYAGKKLVFSCDVSGMPEGVEWTFGIGGQNINRIKMKNGRVFATVQVPDGASVDIGENLMIDDIDRPLTADQLANVKFSNFMLQEGEIPTAYMPAFEEFSGGVVTSLQSAKYATLQKGGQHEHNKNQSLDQRCPQINVAGHGIGSRQMHGPQYLYPSRNLFDYGICAKSPSGCSGLRSSDSPSVKPLRASNVCYSNVGNDVYKNVHSRFGHFGLLRMEKGSACRHQRSVRKEVVAA